MEKNNKETILVIDREGMIAEGIVRHLNDEFFVVLVTDRTIAIRHGVVIPFKKNKAFIPSYRYSYILFMYSGKAQVREVLSQIIKKAEGDNALFFLVADVGCGDKTLYDYVLGSYDRSRIIIHGSLFGAPFPLRAGNIIQTLLYQAINGAMKIPGDGLARVHAVFFDDMVAHLARLVFSSESLPRVSLLFPEHASTILSVARMIHKQCPLASFDFAKTGVILDSAYYIPQDARYVLKEGYSIESGLRLAIKKMTEKDTRNEVLSQHTAGKRGSPLRIWAGVCYVLIILLLPIIIAYGSFVAGLLMLKSSESSFEQSSFQELKDQMLAAGSAFRIAEKTALLAHAEFSLVGAEEPIESLQREIRLGKKAAEAFHSLLSGLDIARKIFSGESTAVKEDYLRSANLLRQSAFLLQGLEAETEPNSDFQEVVKKVRKIDWIINAFTNTTDIAPKILGFDKERVYVVLFQNNAELRPGGGFIGSYGMVRVRMGKVEEFSIHNVYDADGQLKGHIEPPFAIRRHLPSEHLYLRDSNFDIDFPKGASVSARLLYEETGEKVDGVIAVDVSFVGKLLEVIGPVYVQDYKTYVTADNLLPLAQEHAEKNSFAGSTQKKDFLKSLLTSLQTKLTVLGSRVYPKVIPALGSAIQEKHVLAAFANTDIQDAFMVNGMSSSIRDTRKPTARDIIDFLGVSEANLGVNKANANVRRRISYDLAIADNGTIRAATTVAIKNRSIGKFGADYKNYLRFIIPLNSSIISIVIDGKPQVIVPAVVDPAVYEGKEFRPPEGLEVERYEEENKTVVGFLVTIPKDTIRTVRVSYSLPQSVLLSMPTFSYHLRVFKQPGIDSYPFVFSLNYPKDFRVTSSSLSAQTGEGKAVFETVVATDTDLHIVLSKK